MFNEYFKEKQATIMSIGDNILSYLADDSYMGELAERDIEKLARIFRILFFSPMAQVNISENEVLNDILRIFGKGGEIEDETET